MAKNNANVREEEEGRRGGGERALAEGHRAEVHATAWDRTTYACFGLWKYDVIQQN